MRLGWESPDAALHPNRDRQWSGAEAILSPLCTQPVAFSCFMMNSISTEELFHTRWQQRLPSSPQMRLLQTDDFLWAFIAYRKENSAPVTYESLFWIPKHSTDQIQHCNESLIYHDQIWFSSNFLWLYYIAVSWYNKKNVLNTKKSFDEISTSSCKALWDN